MVQGIGATIFCTTMHETSAKRDAASRRSVASVLEQRW